MSLSTMNISHSVADSTLYIKLDKNVDISHRLELASINEQLSLNKLYFYIDKTSIAHRIENSPRRTSELFVKNVSWSSKINGSFGHNYAAVSDFTAT